MDQETPISKNPEDLVTHEAVPTPAPSPLKRIRTYQGDVAEALKSQNESIVSIELQEHARHTEQKVEQTKSIARDATTVTPERIHTEVREDSSSSNEEQSSSNKKGLLLFIGIILLLGLGGAGAWYAYTGYQTKTALPIVEVVPNTFITAESRVDFDTLTLTRESLIKSLDNARNTNQKVGSVEQIQFHVGTSSTPPLLTTSGFLGLIGSHAPANLVRSFNPLFMVGNLGGTPGHTFVVIGVDSFDNAFPGMLSWEPDLANDTLALFVSSSTLASTTPDAVWHDATIQNKNIRALKDTDGKTILLYTFYDNQKLIITDSETSLTTIIGRLDSKKLSH